MDNTTWTYSMLAIARDAITYDLNSLADISGPYCSGLNQINPINCAYGTRRETLLKSRGYRRPPGLGSRGYRRPPGLGSRINRKTREPGPSRIRPSGPYEIWDPKRQFSETPVSFGSPNIVYGHGFLSYHLKYHDIHTIIK